ncbi:hypothetical protein [Pendulispora albinea]|uniref:Uncharacterized protein n=1 Tax=Pendulispora albinea TaxID=2741071 RepID=A0ABZ2M4K7_9BACT
MPKPRTSAVAHIAPCTFARRELHHVALRRKTQPVSLGTWVILASRRREATRAVCARRRTNRALLAELARGSVGAGELAGLCMDAAAIGSTPGPPVAICRRQMMPFHAYVRDRALIALLTSSLLACSTSSSIHGAESASGLQGFETSDGAYHLRGTDGSSVHVRASDTLRITTSNGRTFEGKGRDFCRSAKGLFLREEGGTCEGAIYVGSWDDIGKVDVEQFDGAATVGVTAFAAAVAVVVVLVVMGTAKKSGSGGGGGGGGSGALRVGAGLSRAAAVGMYALASRPREPAPIRVADPWHWVEPAVRARRTMGTRRRRPRRRRPPPPCRTPPRRMRPSPAEDTRWSPATA